MAVPRIDSLDRNFLLNGDYRYFQRASTAGGLGTPLTPAYKSADRFLLEFTEALTAGTFDRVVDSPNLYTKYAGSFIINTATSTNIIRKSQRIESIFATDLANKQVSYKLNYKTDGAQSIRVRIVIPDVEDNYTTSVEFYNQVFSATNDSTWKTIVIENLSIPATANRGVEIIVESFNWANLGVSTFISFAQEKLSIGTKVQDFSLMGRNSVDELSLCQRYFETTSIQGEPFSNGISADGVVSHQFQVAEFKTTKRLIPVIIYLADASMTFFTPTISRFGVFGLYTGGFGRKYSWSADAEL